MIDREKVIKGLETCIKYIDKECPIGCPYHEICTKYEGRVVFQPVLRDALILLKEQEAVKPFYEEGEDFLNYFMKHTYGRCGHCKAPLPALDGLRSKFCWMCGRQVKWE